MVRRSTRNRLREYVITAFLSLLIIWLLSLVWGIARKEEIARHTVRDTQAQLAALESRKQVLADTLKDLSSERGQEASLRQTFGVAKPGEEVIIVVPPKDAPPPPPKPWWRKALDAVGL